MNLSLIFDLDDTLYKEVEFLKSGFKQIDNYLNTKYGIVNSYDLAIKSYYSNKQVIDELVKYYNIPSFKDELLNIYRFHLPNINLEDHTIKTLNILKKRNLHLGIITDGRYITQMNKIFALGLEDFFLKSNIIISEKFGKSKPSLDNYLFFHSVFKGSDFFYIGDNIDKDFISPNLLNWTSVCINDDGRNIHKQNFNKSSEYLPKIRINSIDEIIKYI